MSNSMHIIFYSVLIATIIILNAKFNNARDQALDEAGIIINLNH